MCVLFFTIFVKTNLKLLISIKMEFIRVNSDKDEYADELTMLYLETFPETQRHTESDFRKLLGTEERFHCNAVLMNRVLVGFFHYWLFDDFVFLEHIAVEPPIRGHKLGEKIVSMAQQSTDLPLVLEVEKAEDSEWGARRIEFYHRLGFQIIPVEYVQPPYRKDGEYISLHLMSDNVEYVVENYEKIKNVIYKNVYKVPNE